jgi:subfamily B ATP-binding cassette protein MsbA
MNQLKRLLPYIKPHRGAIMLGVICMVISGAMDGIFLLLMERVLEPMLDSSAPAQERLYKLNLFTFVVLAVAAVRGFADCGQVYIMQRTGQRILARLRSDLFAHFQDLSINFFERRRTGEVMSRMTNDLSALQTVLTLAVATTISAPIAVATSVAYMGYKNWKLSLFVLFILPPVAFLINRAGRKTKQASAHLQTQLANLTNYLQEKMTAMRLIQTFGTKVQEIALFKNVNDAAYSSTMEPIRIQATLGPLIEFIGMAGVMLCLWFGAHDVVAGTMTAGALVTFLFAVHRAAMRAKALASLNLMFNSAEAAASRIWEIMDTPLEIRDTPHAIDLTGREVRGHLTFDKVSFSYDHGPQVLHSISFEIKPGEVVALAGASGSGKSTIASLVPRLYDPTDGRVCLDGLDLREVSLLSLRSHIGAVPQETTLFHGTIRDNIAYGRPQASLEEVVEAAQRANADDFIRAQPEGYETQIGERGGRLSGGQRQRIAIARALLRDPRILILDEATSSLDAESEVLVQDALGKLMEGRTTLIIAHRFSTILRANRILVLDMGHIAETGTHTELLQRGGIYHRLFQMQAFTAHHDDEEEVAATD